MVKAESNDPEALLAALKSGAFYASSGPEIHAIEVADGKAIVECSAAANVALLGRGSRSENTMGPAQTRVVLETGKFAGDWFRVVVIDRAGKRAWSNPIWFD
jgi:hypothetical protein